jgi:hypothetical protein
MAMAVNGVAHAKNIPSITIILYKGSRPQNLTVDIEYDMNAIPDIEIDGAEEVRAKDATISRQSFWSKVEDAGNAVNDIMQRSIRLQQAKFASTKIPLKR